MQHFFKLLKNKTNVFYSLINKANFINFSKYVKDVIAYYSDIYVDIAINLIITFSCLLIFSILKWEFLIIFLVNFFLAICITLFQINFNKKRIKTMVLKTNELNNNLLFFFDKKINQNFASKLNEDHLINQLLKVDDHLIYDETFNYKINNINESLQQFFNIVMYFVSWYFFPNDHSFGKIFLIISLFSYCNNSSKFLLNLFINHKSLSYIKEIISFFYNSSNNLNKFSKLLYHPFSLKFKNNLNSNKFIIKFKENEIRNVFDYCYEHLLINGFNMHEYSQKELNQNLIKINLASVDDYTELEEILHLNDFSKERFLKFISNTQINFNDFEHVKNYNFEIIAILNLFKLTLLSNKLILINNNFGYFGFQNQELVEILFEKITLNNAVVYLTKFNEPSNKVFTEIYDA